MQPETREKTSVAMLLAVAAVAAAAAMTVWQEARKTIEPPPPLSVLLPSQLARLRMDFGDGTVREFRGEVVPDMKVLHALQYSAEAGSILLSVKETAKGAHVAVLDGKKAEKKKQWVFYVNGAKGEDPAAHAVQPRDFIEWRYE